jgi:crossover junction endodeoxyribonuclease RuvC
MIILGIDPGLEITGYGAIETAGEEIAIIEAGVIRTNVRAKMADRLAKLYQELAVLLAEIKPELAAVEKLYAHYKHPRTAILMGHARGTILCACGQAGVSVRDMPATMVKRALTGNGHAAKLQVQLAIQSLCRLEKIPQPPDVADALAIAICASRHHGMDG